jgi:hypothetical protein
MPDRAHHSRRGSRTSVATDPDQARTAYVTARIAMLEELERCLLELAVQATDDSAACWLEAWAETAWRDAVALGAEHDAGHTPEGG